MAYDNPEGTNAATGGREADSNGVATGGWSSPRASAGRHGSRDGGRRIRRRSAPDLILMAYDSPSGPNNFRYKIGWNLNVGVAASWTDLATVPDLGWEGQGPAAVVRNFNGRPSGHL